MFDGLSILFLSDTNSLRSQIAESCFKSRNISDVSVRSAGITSAPLHPLLENMLGEHGYDTSELKSESVTDLKGQSFDLIITMGEEASRIASIQGRSEHQNKELLPLFVGTPMYVSWVIEGLNHADHQNIEFIRKVRDQVEDHVHAFIDRGYLEAFLTERRRIKLIVDAIDTGLVVHDEKRRIYLFNKAASKLTGRAQHDVLGRNCHDVFPPDGICGSFCAFKKGYANPFERRDYQVAFTTADGQGKKVRMLATPLEIHRGRPAEVVAQVTDVTEIDRLKWELNEKQSLHGMVGDSASMRGVFEIIRQVASSDYPVLITGESGTGKELAARAIHKESRRSEGPFVPINCGALPEHILESELFGHVRGAFTGAIRDKKGRFELAHGGTLFLDEVGELTPSFQVKLLRVLQEMKFERVGGERTIDVDVRIISATNRDLREMVTKNEFREDLFYRLCVVPIALPPLRDRRSDIPLIIIRILDRIRKETSKPDLALSPSAMDLLLEYVWPGNVRELINALQFAAIRCIGQEVSGEHLPPEVRQNIVPGGQPLPSLIQSPHIEVATPKSRKKLDVELVAQALNQTGGNKVRAAKLLGVGRATLYRFLNDHPLES